MSSPRTCAVDHALPRTKVLSTHMYGPKLGFVTEQWHLHISTACLQTNAASMTANNEEDGTLSVSNLLVFKSGCSLRNASAGFWYESQKGIVFNWRFAAISGTK